jgi:hypothetical protein
MIPENKAHRGKWINSIKNAAKGSFIVFST